MSVSEEFARQLRSIRAEKKLSQEKMSELCQLSSRHYHDLELGKVNPSLETVAKVSLAFNISIDAIIKNQRRGNAK